MADDVSAEEQRQIDAAIALSLGQQFASPVGTARPSGKPSGREIIDIEDSSSDNEGEASTSAAKAGQAPRSINATKKHNDRSASVDSEATEESDVDESRLAIPVSVNNKRKPEREDDDTGADAVKRARTETTSSKIEETTRKLDVPHRTQNMDPGRYILGGASRAEMEKERLARVAARQAAQQADGRDPSSVTGIRTLTSASSATSGRPASVSTGARIATLSSINASEETTPSLPQTKDVKINAASASSRIGTLAGLAQKSKNTMYWNGIVRPTSSRFHSGYECFTFADVVGNTDDMQSALLATFCGTPEWIHSHFPDHVKIALVMPCAEHNRFEAMQVAPNMRLMNPVREIESRGVMHIKLVLLYHKDYLRVAVATANLIDYDWTTIENAVYVQDFPRTSTPTDPESSPFLKTLLRAHRSLGTPTEYYKNALLNFDYSAASKVRLVLSVPGTFKSPSDIHTSGHTGLSHSLQELGLVLPPEGAKLDIEAQGSSIGSYTLDWMRTFYRSCLGWDPKSLNLRTPTSKRVVPYRSPEEWPDVKIVFPTFKTVKESINGPQGGGTIFCPLDYWRKPKFPKQLFYDSRSKRDGLLQHTKMILAIAHAVTDSGKGQLKLKSSSDAGSTTPFKPFGWLYVGSHNFTPAAWGRYSEKTGNLSIANHELGVVVPLTQADIEAEGSFLATWKRPLQRYGPKDTPWDQHSYRGNDL